MTMPCERTRALRWGWELLLDLKSLDVLERDQQHQIELILTHYPSADEIELWALVEAARTSDRGRASPFLAPEEVVNPTVPGASSPIQRRASTPVQRVNAILLAGTFFKSLRGAENVPPELKKQIPHVLRHFPGDSEIRVRVFTSM